MRSIIAIVSIAFAFVSQVALAGEQVDYVTQLKPIFAARCYPCHSALRQRSGLRLDTAALLIKGGDSGASVEPGISQDSLLVAMLTGESGVRMPPEEEGAALTDAQIALVKLWIDQGAPAPEETTPPDPSDHWSFRPPERPALPHVSDASRAANPMDAFLAAAHESHGLAPVAAADKATLLRRVYFDVRPAAGLVQRASHVEHRIAHRFCLQSPGVHAPH